VGGGGLKTLFGWFPWTGECSTPPIFSAKKLDIFLMKKKPEFCYANCKYAGTGIGFIPDEPGGNARIAVLAEAPGASETLDSGGEDGYGRPLVGYTGRFWETKVLLPLDLRREDILICNTIRCRPPRNSYPTGELRKQAESACRHWDGKLDEFNPDIFIVTFHPAACLPFRTPQFFPFLVRAHELAKKFMEEGRRPLILMGDKAMNLKAPWLEGGVKRWERHFWEAK